MEALMDAIAEEKGPSLLTIASRACLRQVLVRNVGDNKKARDNTRASERVCKFHNPTCLPGLCSRAQLIIS